jgi:outer membrane protein assembly factor BamB
VVNATNRVRGYDLKNGDVIWECSGMTANAIPSPVAADGVLYVMSGFRGNALLAIRLAGAKGDITGTDAVVWSYDKDTPYVPSPLLYGNTLYFLKHNKGILSGLNTETGEQNYMQRLENIEGMYASPVGAKDRIYLVGRNGVSLVIKHGAEYEVLSSNVLDESFSASPAIADGELYLRGQSTLYCIAKE